MSLFWLFQVERAPKKPVIEEFEEFDYSDLYDEMSVSTVTTSPNVTDYEVRLSKQKRQIFVFPFLIPFFCFYSSYSTVCVCWKRP